MADADFDVDALLEESYRKEVSYASLIKLDSVGFFVDAPRFTLSGVTVPHLSSKTLHAAHFILHAKLVTPAERGFWRFALDVNLLDIV
jgi:hypothetical protein